MYHPTNTGTVSGAPISYSPTGKWKHSDWWGDPESPGYKDFGPNSSYDVNPLIPNPALASLQPISKLSASVMRITLRRLNLPSNPPYRALINNQWKGQDPGNYIADGLQWSGCWIGTGIGINDGRDFIRPLYVEAYLRIPNATLGNGAGFWMYESGRSTNTHSGAAVKPEVDIFDISGDPNTWYSHLHGTGHEAEFVASPSEPYSGWHKYGFLWQTNSLSIYRDDVPKKDMDNKPRRYMVFRLHECYNKLCWR